MSLAALIRGKVNSAIPATATSATLATLEDRIGRTVATVATVTVASPEIGKLATMSAGDSCWWLIRFPNREPVKTVCPAGVSHAEIMAWHPGAATAEPLEPPFREPSGPMTAPERNAIRTWLALIEETDAATIAEVLAMCERDADAREYFTGHSWRRA